MKKISPNIIQTSESVPTNSLIVGHDLELCEGNKVILFGEPHNNVKITESESLYINDEWVDISHLQVKALRHAFITAMADCFPDNDLSRYK